MGIFKRAPKKPQTIIDTFNRAFAKMDFENARRMSKLFDKAKTSKRRLEGAVKKIKGQVRTCTSKLSTFEDRMSTAVEQEKILAAEMQGQEKVSLDTLTQLKYYQSRKKGLNREKKDYELTLETLQHFLVDIADAINHLDHIIGSLERNLMRVKAAESILEIDHDTDFSVKTESILGIDIDLSDADAATANEKKLKKLLTRAENKLDKIAEKAQVEATVIYKKARNENSHVGFFASNDGYYFAVSPMYRHGKKYSIYEAFKDRESLPKILEKLPVLLQHVEEEVRRRNETASASVSATIEALSGLR